MDYKKLLIFLAGTTIGGVSSWYFTKKKYEDILKKEIEDVKSYYSKRSESKTSVEEVEPIDISNDADSYRSDEPSSISFSDYNDINRASSKLAESESPRERELPYIINPYDFGFDPRYESSTLLYYPENDTLIDESTNDIIDDNSIVGDDILRALAESMHDRTIYVRNDAISMEYEIIKIEGVIDYENMPSREYAYDKD